MVSSDDNIFSTYTQRIQIPFGATLAVFVNALPAQKAIAIKYLSGGTLEILPSLGGVSLLAAQVAGGSQTAGHYQVPFGTTQTAQALANLNQTGYLMGTSEVLTFDGTPSFYLSATGASVFVAIIRGCGAGT